MMTKKEIRKQIFQKRREADAAVCEKNSEIICEKIMETEAFLKASVIYVYMDCKGEVSIRPLLLKAWEMGKKTAAPRVTGPGEMKYYYITSYEDVEPGYYDIPEPVKDMPQAHDEDALLIVPGVAFDKNCHRCGYGQGFYDRYLQKHTQHTTVAVAFDFQMVDKIPAGEYDIFPQRVMTEKEVYICKN